MPASLIRKAALRAASTKGSGGLRPPPPLCGFPCEACWQGKTNSAEPRQSKPGSRAKSAGPKVGLRPTRWLGPQVWRSEIPGPKSDSTSCFPNFPPGFPSFRPFQHILPGPKSWHHTLNPNPGPQGPAPGPKCQIPKSIQKVKSKIFPEVVPNVPRIIFHPLGYYFGGPGGPGAPGPQGPLGPLWVPLCPC